MGGGGGAIGDAVSYELVIANTNCSVVVGNIATCILVTNETDTNIFWDTFEGTPIHRNIVLDVVCVREYNIVARKTTAFEFFWRIIVHTE